MAAYEEELATAAENYVGLEGKRQEECESRGPEYRKQGGVGISSH